jgi:aryl-alcohol dehydrogenase-like predicted oxidoreductase
MVWSPLAGGLLSGKFGPGSATGRRARAAPASTSRRSTRSAPGRCVDAMREIGEAHGVSVARVALAWLLAKPFVTSVIIGAKTMEQLDDNLAAADLKA